MNCNSVTDLVVQVLHCHCTPKCSVIEHLAFELFILRVLVQSILIVVLIIFLNNMDNLRNLSPRSPFPSSPRTVPYLLIIID